MHRTLLRALALVLLTAVAAPAQAQLWDSGLLHGGRRSDLPDAARGTAGHPLTYAQVCQFPQSPFAICPSLFVPIPGVPQPQPARVFGRSNWQSTALAAPEFFWVVSANAEPALDPLCNSGPPNQSEAVGAPLEDVFGLAVQPSPLLPWRNEAVLAVDLSHRPRQLEDRPGCVTRDYIPFLALGVDTQRGNGGHPLARIGGGLAAPILRFDYRLLASNAALFAEGGAPPMRPRGQHAGLFIEAQWGGVRRSVWLTLFNAFDVPAASTLVQWNWALPDSFYYPGAEIVVTSPRALLAECGPTGFSLPAPSPGTLAHGAPVDARLDLARLYACLSPHFSAPLPAAAVPVTGLHFFVEVGVRDSDGAPGLSAQDWDSRLAFAVSDVDIVEDGSVGASDAGFLQVVWDALSLGAGGPVAADLLPGQRNDAIATMLGSVQSNRGLVGAARWSLVAQGIELDASLYDALLELQRAGAADAALARAIASHPAHAARHGALPAEAYVRAVFANVLGPSTHGLPLDAVLGTGAGSLREWRDALEGGQLGRDAVLLAAYRLAEARGLLQREAEIVALYRVFLGILPDRGGISGWRDASHMPQRLIEVLYFGTGFRRQPQPGG